MVNKMKNEKRFIDANAADVNEIPCYYDEYCTTEDVQHWLNEQPTVDAVEVEDEELLKAIKMLIKQYAHSKQSDYVHSPVAHALFHTWKKVDGDGNG